MSQKHTPLPWKISSLLPWSASSCDLSVVISGADKLQILNARFFAGLGKTIPEAEANAQFIVRACNEHEALRAVAEAAKRILAEKCEQAESQLESALARLEGGK